MISSRRWSLLLVAGLVWSTGLVRATNLPSDFDEETVADGLDKPTAFAYAADGRLFITEKAGRVRVVSAAGLLLPTPVLTVAVNTDNDRGLLGIALHPNFLQNGWLYLAYTTPLVPPAPANGYSRIHRITRWTISGNVAIPGSEVVVVDNIPSDMDSHNGGQLRFGPDGKLYATIGDGASYFSVDSLALRALNLDQLPGKVLRLNDDGSAPTDNPFYNGPTAIRSKVWQYGLRNPFKATFRPSTGRLYISDVGWNDWEELDSAPAGASFGWPCWEGNSRQPLYNLLFPGPCRNVTGTLPVWTYGHNGDGGAITGGAFFEGNNYPPSYAGKLFISDYAQRFIKLLDLSSSDVVNSVTPFASGDGTFRPVDLTVAPDGNLQYINIATDFSIPSGSVRRILYVGAGNHAPKAVAQASPVAGYVPLVVNFDGSGSSDLDNDPLSFHWNFGDGSEATTALAPHTYNANGTYLAVLDVSDGLVTRSAKVTIVVGSLPPRATIDAPAVYRTYVDGETINYSGHATDPDQGNLSGSALRWTIIQHHNGHEHAYADSTGSSGAFVAHAHGGSGETISYEIVLAATDASGLADTKRQFVFANQPPLANAGPDQAVTCVGPRPRVFLDGRASTDPDPQPVTYLWSQTAGPAVVLEQPTSALASFLPPAVSGGTTLTFRLSVDDGHGPVGDDVTVIVPDLTDADADSFPACSDCAPNDALQHPPLAVERLVLDGDYVTLRWAATSGVLSYDLARGTLTAGWSYSHGCAQSGLVTTTTTDSAVPAIGTGFYYLVRAVDGCGTGSYGANTAGEGRPNQGCP